MTRDSGISLSSLVLHSGVGLVRGPISLTRVYTFRFIDIGRNKANLFWDGDFEVYYITCSTLATEEKNLDSPCFF